MLRMKRLVIVREWLAYEKDMMNGMDITIMN